MRVRVLQGRGRSEAKVHLLLSGRGPRTQLMIIFDGSHHVNGTCGGVSQFATCIQPLYCSDTEGITSIEPVDRRPGISFSKRRSEVTVFWRCASVGSETPNALRASSCAFWHNLTILPWGLSQKHEPGVLLTNHTLALQGPTLRCIGSNLLFCLDFLREKTTKTPSHQVMGPWFYYPSISIQHH